MLPVDTDWFANDGNEEITHDWTNAIELSVNAIAASEANGATWPAPAGTTLPWGGGRIIYVNHSTGIASGATDTLDDSIDWRNRWITVTGGFYDAANKLPMGAASPAAQPTFTYYMSQAAGVNRDILYGYLMDDGLGTSTYLWLYDAGGGNIISLTAPDASAGALRLFNNIAGVTIYPFLRIEASDQFPTRI